MRVRLKALMAGPEGVFPDTGSTKAAFAAYVANISPVAPIAGALELNVTLRVAGPVTWS